MRLKLRIAVLILLSILLFAPGIRSEDQPGEETPPVEKTPKKEKLFKFDIDGYYRLRYTELSHMNAFPEGVLPGVHWWDQRLRVSPSVTIRPNLSIFKSLTLHTTADIYDGYFGAANPRPQNVWSTKYTWDEAFLAKKSDYKANGFLWREYWAEADLTAFVIQVGQMGSDWGHGILASGGNTFNRDFGDSYFGDVVDRVLIATKPIDLVTGGKMKTDIVFAIGYDWLVVQDRLGSSDDNPHEVLIALLKRPEKVEGEDIVHDISGGLYYAYRTQNPVTTIANAVDFTFSVPVFLLDKKLKLSLNFEGLYAWGHSDANRSLLAPDGSDLSQFGLMTTLAAETKRVDGILEIGLASGDPNPFDDKIQDFHFNPDYNVGLILFKHVLSAATANSAYRFSNASLGAIPPAGIDLTPTNGSVTNAFYVNPRLKARPFKGLELIIGLLYAMAPQDLMDPYQSFLNGGYATNYRGGDAASDLGYELDVGASYKYTIGKNGKYAARVGGQWGWFWPGDAFKDAHGRNMDKINLGQFRLDFLF